MSKKVNRGSAEDSTHAARLLRDAREGRSYVSAITGSPVPASIIARADQGTPLNEREQEAFEFIRTNPDAMGFIGDRVAEATAAGYQRYSAGCIFELLRWHVTVTLKRTDDTFRLNDHHAATIARWVNEAIAEPFLTCRRMEGEPKDDDPTNVPSDPVPRHEPEPLCI